MSLKSVAVPVGCVGAREDEWAGIMGVIMNDELTAEERRMLMDHRRLVGLYAQTFHDFVAVGPEYRKAEMLQVCLDANHEVEASAEALLRWRDGEEPCEK